MATLQHPLETARFVAANAEHVICDQAAAKRTAEHLLSVIQANETLCKVCNEEEGIPPGLSDIEKLHWIFLISTWNFCFWGNPGEKPFGVFHNGQLKTGVRSLTSAVLRAHEEGLPVCQPDFYAKATQELVEEVLKSDTETPIPLLEQRWKNVQEVGQVLKKRFSNSVVAMMEEAGGDAWKLVILVAENFQCYHDVAEFKGRSVSLLKRAQIFVSDVHFMFQGESFGKLEGMDRLTMFPDYRVPQSLQYFGVMKYTDELLEKLRNEEELEPGSVLEVEIRACSILSVELVREELQKLLQQSVNLSKKTCLATEIDNYLWKYAKSHVSEMDSLRLPIHHTRTIFY